MGYILDLRKYVGHRPLIQVGASVIVEDSQGRILLQLRSDNHCWGTCGGSIEPDERVEDAARRELFEETGLTAEALELFGVFSGPELHYVYPNGDEVSNIDIVFLCRSFTGELPTLVVHNTDQPGCVSQVTGVLARRGLNVATLQLNRDGRGESAVMVIESDHVIFERAAEEIRGLPGILRVTRYTPEGLVDKS